MANVPTIPIPGGQTARTPTAYDNRRSTPDDYGAGIAEAGARAAVQVQRYRDEADALGAQRAERQFAEDVLGIVHDGEKGFRSLKGDNAARASGAVLEELEKRRAKIAEGLANDRQRALFMDRSHQELIGAKRSVEEHTGKEIDWAKGEEFKARAKVAADLAIAAYLSPEVRQAQLDNMTPWLELEAERRGHTGDAAQRFVDEWKAGVVEGVYNRLANEGQVDEARRFIDGQRKTIGDAAWAVLDGKLRGAEKDVKVAAKLDEIVEGARGKNGRVDEVAVRREARKLPANDPHRKEVLEGLKGRLAEEADSWKEQGDALLDQAYEAYVAGGRGARGLKAVPRSIRDQFVAAENGWGDREEALVALSRKDVEYARRVASGFGSATPGEGAAFAELLDKMYANKEASIAGGLPALRKDPLYGKLHPDDRRKADLELVELKERSGRPDEALPASVAQRILERGRKAGVFPKTGTPQSWGAKGARFRAIYDDVLPVWNASKGKGTDPSAAVKEVDAVIDSWLNVKGEVDGSGLVVDDVVTRVEWQTDDNLSGKPFLPVVPETELPEVDARLGNLGLPAGNPEWRRWYYLKARGAKDEQNPMPELPRPVAPPGGVTPAGAASIAAGRGGGSRPPAPKDPEQIRRELSR